MNKKLFGVGIIIFVVVLLLGSRWQSIRAESGAAPIKQADSYGDELDAFIENRMQEFKIPGLSLAVVRDGAQEYIKSYGVANPEGDPVTPQTPFLLASVSKSFTALAVMQLVEAGKIDLAAPVQDYLPWFTVAGGGEAEITVADLLYQTSGFSEWDGMQMNLRPDRPDGLEAGVRDLSRVKLKFQPGEGWEYSNINFNLLGLLIQEVSGQRYEAYIQENIFERLGMRDSYTSLSSARAGNAALGYYPFFGMQQVIETIVPTTVLPAAGLWSNAADMSSYLVAHLGDGSALGLSPQELAGLHTPGAEIDPGFSYAMGWFHVPNVFDPEFLKTLDTSLDPTDDLHVLYHEGEWEGFKSVAFLMPGQDFGVILLMNISDPTITSVFRYFAWEVTLIANGGDAYYFQPGEEFIVRYSRWIFSGLTLLLLAGLIWAIRQWSQTRLKKSAWINAFLLLLNLALLGYLYLKLMPENNASIRGLLRSAPDLGILTILMTAFSVAWIAVSLMLLVKTRRQSNAQV